MSNEINLQHIYIGCNWYTNTSTVSPPTQGKRSASNYMNNFVTN